VKEFRSEAMTPAATDGSLRDRVFAGLSRRAGRGVAKFIFRFYDLVRFDLFGRPPFGIGSIDITRRCNLKCKHCYFMEYGYGSELTDEQWLAFFDRLKETPFPFYQASWIGGEPLLRKELVGRLMRMFRSNVVATNGTIPLPDWPDVNFYVSVDGTREFYREMRGREWMYDRIIENTNRPDLRIIIAMVVARNNWQCIPDLLAEWRSRPIRGVLFQFYTPIAGQQKNLWTGWELRDRCLDMLIRLRRKYGDFIVNPPNMLQLMKHEEAPSITARCPYSRDAYALAPDGSRKLPCMMGDKADCSRCGCVLPFHSELFRRRSLVFRELLRSAGSVFGGKS
jgi:MoaA/NifB/PqqE/SkfB family radical SAM enzyme